MTLARATLNAAREASQRHEAHCKDLAAMGCPDECACTTCLADLRTMANAMPAILDYIRDVERSCSREPPPDFGDIS